LPCDFSAHPQDEATNMNIVRSQCRALNLQGSTTS